MSSKSAEQGNVSIHAPLGGATRRAGCHGVAGNVSIHAPLGGATTVDAAAARYLDVSIHAPLGGATCKPPTCRAPISSFNPRAPRGRDHRRQ